MPQAMKIPDAKAAVDKEWKKLETIPAWELGKVKSAVEAHKETKRKSTLLHWWTKVKKVELEPKWNKYKGRVVPQGDIAKEDSGAYAVFTEQGSSASQMTAAKDHGCNCKITRLRWTSSWRSICLYPGKIEGCSQIAQNSLIGMSRCLDAPSTTQMAKIMG